MHKCPITYELSEERYSKKGLALLSRSLKNLRDFPLSAEMQLERAEELTTKLSIQGVQPKLSIKLQPAKEIFEVVERGGTYILKPPHEDFEELPQNEDLTMKLAALVGLEVPVHGLIYNIDGTLSYFIKRFDRISRRSKLAVEDFSQVMGFTRDVKYESSMEKVIKAVEEFCTFPVIEKQKLFRLVLFNFLVGNEDMHLKNYSLITRDGTVTLSPCYDLLNSSIVLRKIVDEIALPIRGRKSNLNYSDIVEYFALVRLSLTSKVVEDELHIFQDVLPKWYALVAKSFLSLQMQKKYQELISQRWQRIQKP